MIMSTSFSSTEIVLILVIILLIVILLSNINFELNLGEKPKKEDNLSELSPTEYKVLESLANGKSNKEIAEEMFVSVGTVKKHVTSIYKKLNISKRSEARTYLPHFSKEKT